MMEMVPLLVFAAFALICIFWMGQIVVGQRKQNNELVNKIIGFTNRAQQHDLDREPSETLPDYIPMQGANGGFYRQADGQWLADLNDPIVRDSPLGGREQSTVAAVDGVFPEDIVVEDE